MDIADLLTSKKRLVPAIMLVATWCVVLPSDMLAQQSSPTEGNDIAEQKLHDGDLSPLEALHDSDSVKRLYELLSLADHQLFGENTAEVRAAVQARLSSIPGHAKYIGDQIEKYTSKTQSARDRENLMFCLALAGTPEALEEAGRFLFDDRNPDGELVKMQPELLRGDYPISLTPNSYSSAQAICLILGDQSPVRDYRRGLSITTEQRNQLQRWWSSQEGKHVRENFKAPVFNQATFVVPAPTRNPSETILKKALSPEIAEKSHAASFSYPITPIVILALLIAGTVILFLRRKSP